MSDSFTSSSYYYSSTTNGSDGRSTTGHRYSTTSHTQGDGTTIVRTAQQELGEPAVVEERRYDHTGQEQLALPEPSTSAGGIRQITDLESDLDADDSAPAPSLLAGAGGPAAQLLDGDGEDDSFDHVSAPLGSRVYDPMTRSYVEQNDYDVGGITRHSHEARNVGGRQLRKHVDFDSDGLSSTAREQRVYEDPSTGSRLRRQSQFDVSDVL
ncbi:hypothetical protein N7452_007095 [Penicillium brevicompactum]|uniref:Uncharacterized protein n=1 Tax=Penicillium brevicompactum TaxID=5074 RepID=A0A9W9UEG0_PENBR|nr:hypothetical protein N7452_007095 [Penicillium brevicompactum]